MGLDAAASRLPDDSDLADLLRDLDRALQDAIADIRRLVYGLRPPALDDLGLVAAVRQQAEEMSSRSGGRDGRPGLVIEVVADELPPLGAAVEVAAYRVAVEAMTNVVRHSGAGRCTVRLLLDDALVVSVEDDGRGLAPGAPAGVGFESMRNRAEELGGAFAVDSRTGGGTVLRVRLPVGEQVPS
jgi:signal transduction histidine kinase